LLIALLQEVANRVFCIAYRQQHQLTHRSKTNGTLAKKDPALNASTKKFTIAASLPGDLPVNNATTDPEALVGASTLPISSANSISDMVVIGDAVYVSFVTAPDAENETGIWSSQALFDDTGKIIRWTPWTKRTIPLNAFPGITLPGGNTHNGSIKFFDIDGTTGNIWLVGEYLNIAHEQDVQYNKQ
jgi:hypothetical protein